MNTTELQRALYRLGFDPGRIDGVDGPKTAAATQAFMNDPRFEQTAWNGTILFDVLAQALDATSLDPGDRAAVDAAVDAKVNKT